jgi:hypothetical protein
MRIFRLLTLASLVFSCLQSVGAYQNQATLRRIGPSPEHLIGDLTGFRVTHTVMPRLSPKQTALAEGTSVSLKLTVVGGKPIHVQFGDDSAPLAQAIRSAVVKWRFDMPRDGTSPVMVGLVVHCDHGKLWHDISVDLPQPSVMP